MIFGNWLWPLRRRQLFSAASANLKIMASAVLFERHPLERTVRWRTVGISRSDHCHLTSHQIGSKIGAIDRIGLPPNDIRSPHPCPRHSCLHASLAGMRSRDSLD